jgi:S1-C subfamily serine protease
LAIGGSALVTMVLTGVAVLALTSRQLPPLAAEPPATPAPSLSPSAPIKPESISVSVIPAAVSPTVIPKGPPPSSGYASARIPTIPTTSAPANGITPMTNPVTASRANPAIRQLQPVSIKKPYLYAWKPGVKYRYGFSVQSSGLDPAESGGKVGVIEYEVDSRLAALAGKGGGDKETATGTAFLVHSDGLLVTCHHVVAGATSVKVYVGDRGYPADVVALDKLNDIAVLRIQGSNLPALSLGDSDQVKLAEDVKAIGFPLSDVLGRGVKVTSGTIAGRIDDAKRKLLQVDISINPGNSGGPLVNSRGEAIGITSSGLFGRDIQEVSFAVPSNLARALLQSIGISLSAPPPGSALSGVDLAAKVAPATCYVEAELGADSASILSFTGNSRSTGAAISPAQQISSRVVASLTGQMLAVQDDAALGPGIGTFASMVFERLPTEGETHWEDSQVFPVAMTNSSGERVRMVLEQQVQYELKSIDDAQIVLSKKITCQGIGRGVVRIRGTGTWTFDRRDGVPVSLDMHLDSSVNLDGRNSNGNSSIHYERLSSDNPSSWQRNLDKQLASLPAPQGGANGAFPKLPELKPLVLEDASDAEAARMISRLRGKKKSYHEYQHPLEMMARLKPVEKRRGDAANALHAIRTNLPTAYNVYWIRAARVWGNEKNVPTLMFIIDSPTSRTADKGLAIEALGRLPATTAAAELVARYIPDRTLGPLALQSLGTMGSKAEGAAGTLLKHNRAEMRMIACIMLGNVGTKKSVPVLEEHLRAETDEQAHSLAQAALKELKRRLAADSQK